MSITARVFHRALLAGLSFFLAVPAWSDLKAAPPVAAPPAPAPAPLLGPGTTASCTDAGEQVWFQGQQGYAICREDAHHRTELGGVAANPANDASRRGSSRSSPEPAVVPEPATAP